MARFVYSTNYRRNGSWLISAEHLAGFDQAIEKELKRLNEKRQSRLKSYLDEEISQIQIQAGGKLPQEDFLRKRDAAERQIKHSLKYENFGCEILLIYRSGAIMNVSSFQEAIVHPGSEEGSPVGLDVTVVSGDVSAKILLQPDGELLLTASPSNKESASEVFAALRNAISVFAPPLWQQLWAKYSGIQWFVWPFALIFFLIASSITSPHQQELRQKAAEILIGGVTADKQPKAIEILLALNVESGFGGLSLGQSAWFYVMGLGLTLACLLLSVRPKVVIGVGRGAVMVKYWKAYLNFVFVSIPSWLLLTMAALVFAKWFNKFIGG